MRIVSWNCCEKFAANYLHLLDLDFDVAVVAECSPIDVGLGQERGLSHAFVRPIPNGPKHLGVFAQEPWRLEPLPFIEPSPWLLPVGVSGPVEFTLLGLWGGEPKRFGSYASQLRHVATDVLPNVDGPVVLAGDLNAPIGSSARAHAENVELLAAQGLVSAFTATRGNGASHKEPTYYRWLRAEHPFHIDHVFVPEAWTVGLTMTVGGFDEWVSSKRSDHVPLIVDVAISQLSPS